MKLVPMSVKEISIIDPELGLLRFVGEIAGECYNSSRDVDACVKRALNCIKRGHHSPFEHANITLKFVVDRGVSHALVRHRHCAFQQSSTIYQKFQEIECIETKDEDKIDMFRQAEIIYHKLLNKGEMPSEARDVLPTDLATGLIITTNIREWMYMLQRRTGHGDSEKMHIWCDMTRTWFMKHYPQITMAFDLWYERHPL